MSGTFSIWHWLILLVIVIAIFGTKKLRNAGGDLGSAVRNFKTAMREGEDEAAHAARPSGVLEAEVRPASTSSSGSWQNKEV